MNIENLPITFVYDTGEEETMTVRDLVKQFPQLRLDNAKMKALLARQQDEITLLRRRLGETSRSSG